jgi:hypothetical protein
MNVCRSLFVLLPRSETEGLDGSACGQVRALTALATTSDSLFRCVCERERDRERETERETERERDRETERERERDSLCGCVRVYFLLYARFASKHVEHYVYIRMWVLSAQIKFRETLNHQVIEFLLEIIYWIYLFNLYFFC